jgi:putative FmdB family regulatory protein
MPLYEYKCTGCEHRLVELQGINDEPLKECPQCNGELKRMISLGSMVEVEYGNQNEYYEKVVKKDAKEIADKIRKGDDAAETEAANIFGEK